MGEWLKPADCKSAPPIEVRRFESFPVHQFELFSGRERSGSPLAKSRSFFARDQRELGFVVNRFVLAMIAYAALAVLAASTLSDHRIRGVTLAVLAMFAVKTWVRRKDVSHPDAESGSEQ